MLLTKPVTSSAYGSQKSVEPDGPCKNPQANFEINDKKAVRCQNTRHKYFGS